MKSFSIYICLFQFFLIGILLPACNLNDQTGKASSPPVNTPNRKTVPVVIPVPHSTPVKTKIARDKVEQKKKEWSAWLSAHPYSNRIPEDDGGEEKKKTDGPDRAAEQNFLMTVDPQLKTVPKNRLESADAYIHQLTAERQSIEINAALPSVTWKERGPSNIGGRTRALAFDLNDPTYKKVWAGGVNGGLWYTNDITAVSPVWLHVDDFWDNIAISTIAIDPSNPNNIYVGTGEGWFNEDASEGAGIWKSVDGGLTWSRLSATIPESASDPFGGFDHVTKIVVKSDGTVFATTRGGYINVGGLYRSTNGGTSWTRVKSQYNSATGKNDFAADVEVASNGDIYVSFGIQVGTADVYRSSDNGATWTSLATALGGMADVMRIEIACSPNANVVYFLAEDATPATLDNDVAWIKRLDATTSTVTNGTIPIYGGTASNHFTRGQAWYNLILAVHPTNSNLVLAGGIDLYRTTDGGANWSQLSSWNTAYGPYVHADQHAIQFRPGDANTIISGNDGGVYYSTDAGNAAVSTPSFYSKNTGYNVTQYYSVSGKNEVNSHHFIGGTQDNGSLNLFDPVGKEANEMTGGDGAFVFIDQDNPNYQITSYTYNKYYFSTDSGRNFIEKVNSPTGYFINPAVWDSQQDILYSSTDADKLMRTTGIGGTVQSTQLNLTNAGGGKITAWKVSPYNANVLIAGLDNGRVLKISQANATPVVTRIDGGSSPITTAGWVSSIDIGTSDDQVLVTFSNYGVTSVWQTLNGGTSWQNKEGNLPDMPVRWAIYNPANYDQVMAATEMGVWTTDNFNAVSPGWGPSNTNLSHTRCDMLYYRAADKMVAVATHGRGIFTTDYFATSSIADFGITTTVSCTGSLTTTLYDQSVKPNSSWAWDIGSNGSVDYTVQNPTHTFAAGLHTVRLTVNNGSSSKVKPGNVLVLSSSPPIVSGSVPSANINFQNGGFLGISRFALNGLDHYSLPDDGNYKDYSCANGTVMLPGTTYTVTVHTGIYYNEGARVYIDYNGDGDFVDANELVATFALGKGGRSTTFTTPETGIVYNTGLRIRVVSAYLTIPANASATGLYGQAEDYTAYFIASALPVQLTEFKADCKEQQVVASWTTSSESNSSHFELQRSVEGEYWETVGRIQAAGNSQSVKRYHFTDKRPFTGATLYRLHQVDADGKDSYSAVIAVSCASMPVLVYPNPASTEITIANLIPGTQLSLFNLQGKRLKILTAQKGILRLPVAAFPAGTYVLQWFENGQLRSKSLIIQH